MKRSRIRPVGRRARRDRKAGRVFGPLADFVRGFGECQADWTPTECGWLPDRTELEICHALSRNAGHGDWTRELAIGWPTVGNVFLACPRCHDWGDAHKARALRWMISAAKENGRLAIEAGIEPVL